MRRHEQSVHGELDNFNGKQPQPLRSAPTLGALIARYARAGRLADDMIDRPSGSLRKKSKSTDARWPR
jgi:hypothetical protein